MQRRKLSYVTVAIELLEVNMVTTLLATLVVRPLT
jgi:hypothetical protein